MTLLLLALVLAAIIVIMEQLTTDPFSFMKHTYLSFLQYAFPSPIIIPIYTLHVNNLVAATKTCLAIFMVLILRQLHMSYVSYVSF